MKKTFMIVIVLALVGAIVAALYRSANNSDLPDDEWFEFENLPE